MSKKHVLIVDGHSGDRVITLRSKKFVVRANWNEDGTIVTSVKPIPQRKRSTISRILRPTFFYWIMLCLVGMLTFAFLIMYGVCQAIGESFGFPMWLCKSFGYAMMMVYCITFLP